MFTFALAKELGWSQRELISKMSCEEIQDWMAYERSISKDFRDKQKEKLIVSKSKEEESNAIKHLFNMLGSRNDG